MQGWSIKSIKLCDFKEIKTVLFAGSFISKYVTAWVHCCLPGRAEIKDIFIPAFFKNENKNNVPSSTKWNKEGKKWNKKVGHKNRKQKQYSTAHNSI